MDNTKLITLVQNMASLWAMSFILNSVYLTVIEVLMKIAFKQKFQFSVWALINLAPKEMTGYKKYYLNFIGYALLPFISFFSFFLLAGTIIAAMFYLPYSFMKSILVNKPTKV